MGFTKPIKADFAAGPRLSDLGRRDYLGLKDHFAVIAETVLNVEGHLTTKLTELKADAITLELEKGDGKLYPWTTHNNTQLQIAQRDLSMN